VSAADIAIFGDEEPVAIYWPAVVAVEHSKFYKGTRVVFQHGTDIVTEEPAADVIEAWHEWMGAHGG
jgi:hypothetical protein